MEELKFVCPNKCKNRLLDKGNILFCDICEQTFLMIEGVPILVPNTEVEFKRLEREYWDSRNDSEIDITQLQKSFTPPSTFSDVWNIRNYLDRVSQEPENSKVLEVGAGIGSQAIPLALKMGYTTYISDLSISAMVASQIAVKRLNEKAPIKFLVADGDHLPFEDCYFDIILVHATLHHFPNPRTSVQEMCRCLRPGGLLVLGHEPNRRVLEPIRKLADKLKITEKYTKRFITDKYSVADDETPGFFGAELRYWMKENNLEIEWMYPIWFLNALFYNLPVVLNILLKTKFRPSKKLAKWGSKIDSKVFARIPGVRNFGLFWSLGARK